MTLFLRHHKLYRINMLDLPTSSMASVFSVTKLWLFGDAMDCSPPGSSVQGISQTRRLEWVAISVSRGSSWPRDQTCKSCMWDSLPLSHLGSSHGKRQLYWVVFYTRLDMGAGGGRRRDDRWWCELRSKNCGDLFLFLLNLLTWMVTLSGSYLGDIWARNLVSFR